MTLIGSVPCMNATTTATVPLGDKSSIAVFPSKDAIRRIVRLELVPDAQLNFGLDQD